MGLCGSAAAVRVGDHGDHRNVGYSTRRLDDSIRKPANAESDMIALLQRLPDIDEWVEKMTSLKLGNPPKILGSFSSSDELHCNFRNFCKYGHVQAVSELLHGSAVDFWCLHGSQKFNETALVLAAKYGQHEVVKLLVSHGAEINYLANGGTALHWACKSYSQDNYARMEPQQVATVQYLLGEGAEMRIGKYDAFHMAVSRGSVPMILLLRATGAEITPEVDEAAKKWGGAVSRAVLGTGEEKIAVPYCAPDYWSNQNESVMEHVEETAVLPLFQAALTSTFKAVRTRDRKGATPQSLRLKKAFRIENSQLWQRFQNASAALERRRGADPGCTQVQMLDGNPETGHVKTSEPLGNLTERLRKPLVEHYLFHGTSPQNAKAIAANGFRRIMAGSNAGTAFGRGCYFAEASSKSDEYAQCDEQGQFVVLLCRVVCGEMFRLASRDPSVALTLADALHGDSYDSVLADRETAVGTYREFVIFDDECVYPEYMLLHDRVM